MKKKQQKNQNKTKKTQKSKFENNNADLNAPI